MITSLQIKKIHTYKNILEMNNVEYIEILRSFGVTTSKQLTETEAKVLIQILEDQVKNSDYIYFKNSEELSKRDKIMATAAQLRKIQIIWKVANPNMDGYALKKSLRLFLENHFAVGHIRFLTKNRARKIIQVLNHIKEERMFKQSLNIV